MLAYKGSGEAVTHVLGGQVLMAIDSASVYQKHIQTGMAKALGVSTPERLPSMPEIPAIAETIPGFAAFPINYLVAAGGTPEAMERLIQSESDKWKKVIQDSKAAEN